MRTQPGISGRASRKPSDSLGIERPDKPAREAAAAMTSREGQAAIPRGYTLLRDPLLNKGTAFTEAERDALGLRGLLPPHVATQDEQATRVIENLRRLPTSLEKHIALTALHDRNETLFFRIVTDYPDEIGRPEDIARLTWYVVDKAEYLASSRPLGRAYREVLGGHYPAMTAVQRRSSKTGPKSRSKRPR
jgi:hypothetical protein